MFIQHIAIRIQTFCFENLQVIWIIMLTTALLYTTNVTLCMFWIIKILQNCILHINVWIFVCSFRVLKEQNSFFKILLDSFMCLFHYLNTGIIIMDTNWLIFVSIMPREICPSLLITFCAQQWLPCELGGGKEH